ALQDVEVVGRRAGAPAEDGDHDPEADHDLGRGDHQDEEHTRLPADVVQHAGERDEREVRRVEHQLDAHEHDQYVAPHEQTDGADAEEDGGQSQVPGPGQAHGVTPAWSSLALAAASSSRSAAAARRGRRASTTAPTTAMTRSPAVASNANR